MRLLPLLLALAFSVSASAQETRPAPAAGDDTFITIEIQSPGTFFAGFRKSALFEVINDPALKDLFDAKGAPEPFDKLQEMFDSLEGGAKEKLGQTLEEALASVGPARLVVSGTPKMGEPKVLISIDLKENDALEGLIALAILSDAAQGKVEKIGGVDVSTGKGRDGKPLFTWKAGSVLSFASDRALAESTIKGTGKPLSENAGYRRAREAVGDAAAFLYINVEPLISEMLKSFGPGGPPKELFPALGFDRLRSVAAGWSFDGGDVVTTGIVDLGNLSAVTPPSKLWDADLAAILASPRTLYAARTHADMKAVLMQGVQQMMMMGQMMGGPGGMPLDKLPLQKIAERAGRGVSNIVVTKDGISFASRSPLGLAPGMMSNVGSVAIIAAIAIPGLLQATRSTDERSASASLRNVATMNFDFRSNDRDADTQSNFWTLDVAGLYGIDNAAGNDIGLIGLDVARADFNGAATYGLTPQPKAGYWYAAVKANEDGTVYDDGTGHHKSRFAFIAYPDVYGTSGNLCYIVDETNTIWKMDSNAAGIVDGGDCSGFVFPSDPAGSGWATID